VLLFGSCEGGGFWPKKSDLILPVHKETIHELERSVFKLTVMTKLFRTALFEEYKKASLKETSLKKLVFDRLVRRVVLIRFHVNALQQGTILLLFAFNFPNYMECLLSL
jgi:hypothetical protein